MIDSLGNSISPDQSNVYYSVKSLSTALKGIVSDRLIDDVVSQTEEFYLPVFVMDSSDSNFIIINVYLRPFVSSSVKTISITKTQVTSTEEPQAPPSMVPVPERNVDKARSIDLSENFHSNNSLKETSWKSSNPTTAESDNRNIEIVASTKSWYDQEIFSNKRLNSRIMVEIVKDSIRNLPNAQLKEYRAGYEIVENQIDSLIKLLDTADEVKSVSVDKIDVGKFLKDVYQEPGADGSYPIEDMKELFLQAFYDLYNVEEYITSTVTASTNTRTSAVDFNSSVRQKNTVSPLEQSFSDVWNAIESLSSFEIEKQPIDRPENNLNSYTNDLFNWRGAQVFETGGLIDTWFSDNLSKKLSGEDAAFDDLNDYLSNFSQKQSNAYNYYKAKGGAGVELLLEQAVHKAILSLCESNLDVYSYSSTVNGINLFSVIGRSGVLGPRNQFPWPSPMEVIEPPSQTSSDNTGGGNSSGAMMSTWWSNTSSSSPSKTNFPIEPFEKTGFLCFHPLIKQLSIVLENLPRWAAENIVDFKTSPHSVGQVLVNSLQESPGVSELYKLAFHVFKNDDDFQNYKSSVRQFGITTDEVGSGGVGAVSYGKSVSDYGYNDLDGISWNKKNDKPVLIGTLGSDGFTILASALEKMDWASYLGFNPTDPVYSPQETSAAGVNLGMGSEDNPPLNCSILYRDRRYNLHYLMNSSLCLIRAVVHKTIEFLVESYIDITGSSDDISAIDVLNSMTIDQNESLMTAIGNIITSIKNSCTSQALLTVKIDGTISAKWASSVPSRSQDTDTPGREALRTICGDYIQFISRISKETYVKIVPEPDEQVIPINLYLPKQAIADNSNPNFKSGHGDVSQYFPISSLKKTWDSLQFTQQELIDNIPKKKYTAAITGRNSDAFTNGTAFMSRFSIYHRHLQVLSEFSNALRVSSEQLDQIQPTSGVSDLYKEGILTRDFSIDDPSNTKVQILSKRNSFRPTADGISRRLVNALETLPTTQEIEDCAHIYVLGLKKNIFDNKGSIELYPTFFEIGSGNDPNNGINMGALQYPGSMSAPIFEISYDPSIIEGEKWLNYLHIYRGLDIGPHSFSENNMPIYSKEIRDNEGEIFPWNKKSFDKFGNPVSSLDTMWCMSPWLFPRNYFYDVVDSNKYHKIVAVTLSKGHRDTLKSFGYFPVQSDTALLGSIQWSKSND